MWRGACDNRAVAASPEGTDEAARSRSGARRSTALGWWLNRLQEGLRGVTALDLCVRRESRGRSAGSRRRGPER